DAQARIDLSTFRKIPWDNELPFFLADFVDNDGNPLYACPRSLLKQVRQQALDMGYQPKFSQEFEWFNFEETPQSLADKDFRSPKPMTPRLADSGKSAALSSNARCSSSERSNITPTRIEPARPIGPGRKAVGRPSRRDATRGLAPSVHRATVISSSKT
ncbi:MAG: hypothetical protein AAFX06_19705, partial [Planctomycetota bacterium]